MLGDEGLSRWSKFSLSDDDRKEPTTVFQKFRDSLDYRMAHATLYNFCQLSVPPWLHIQLSKLIEDNNDNNV